MKKCWKGFVFDALFFRFFLPNTLHLSAILLIKISKHSFFLNSVAFVFILYMVTRPLVTLDSCWVLPTSLSLLNEGNINLDEFSTYEVGNSYAAIQIDNHFYNYFPYGISFLIISIVAVLNILISESFFFQYHGQIEKFCASLLILSSFFFLYNVFSFYISKRKSGFLGAYVLLCLPQEVEHCGNTLAVFYYFRFLCFC